MRYNKFLLYTACLFYSSFCISQTPSFITDSLDSYIQRGMEQWEIPGMAVAIVKDGKVVWMKGYGVREAGKPDKVDENTLFMIASNSKLFTATSIAKLEFEKKLSLNDKVTQYIPWFKLYDSSATRLVNIRDLLCHRLGTKTFQGDFTFWDSDLAKDSIIWKMRYLKPPGQFRQDYGYCNSAFVTAGQILEKVSGQTWENYVQTNFLTPLGMTDTYMNTAGIDKRNNVAKPYNNLYGNLSILPYDHIDNLGPAGSIVSNVKDLTKWLMLQLDSGKYQGKQIIPWQVIQRTRDANTVVGSRKSAGFPMHMRMYALGLFMTDYAGRQIYWHTGGASGYVTNVCFVPEENLGITVLSNNDNQSFFEAVRYQILDAYLGVKYNDRGKYQWGFFVQGKKQTDDEIEALKQRVDKHIQPPSKLEDYTGDYYNTLFGKISVIKRADKLECHFQHHPDLTGYLDYMDNNQFRMIYSNPVFGIYPAKFYLTNGKATSVILETNPFIESDAYLFAKDPNGLMVK